eukprot:10981159-Lingulodinium_polyedra.AAC.1
MDREPETSRCLRATIEATRIVAGRQEVQAALWDADGPATGGQPVDAAAVARLAGEAGLSRLRRRLRGALNLQT